MLDATIEKPSLNWQVAQVKIQSKAKKVPDISIPKTHSPISALRQQPRPTATNLTIARIMPTDRSLHGFRVFNEPIYHNVYIHGVLAGDHVEAYLSLLD